MTTEGTITIAESRECRGQGDGNGPLRLDAGAARGSDPKLELVTVAVAAIDGKNGDRSPRPSRASDDAPGLDSCNGQLPYHCALDRFEGWNPSKLRTCSIVISARTLSKSTPREVVPHSVTRQLGALLTVPFPFSLWGTGTPILN